MKATEQYFPVVLFITLYKVVLIFESVDKNTGLIIPINANVQNFHLAPFDTLFKCYFTFWIKSFKCKNLNESAEQSLIGIEHLCSRRNQCSKKLNM